MTANIWIDIGSSNGLLPDRTKSIPEPMLTYKSEWRHQMEKFSALLALCEGKPLVTGGFPSQRPVTRSFDVLFDLRLNKRFNKQSRRRWFETPSRSLWRHSNVMEYLGICDGRYYSLITMTFKCYLSLPTYLAMSRILALIVTTKSMGVYLPVIRKGFLFK